LEIQQVIYETESKLMKLSSFSFKREPAWIWVFSLAPAALGLLILIVLLLLR
jgi:hypothetical protein